MSIEKVTAEIRWHADEIRKLFLPGAKVSILITNTESYPDHSADVLVAQESNQGIIDAVHAMSSFQPKDGAE